MRDFFVPRDLLIYSHEMGVPSDFSIRGFSGGLGEDGSSMTFRLMAGGTIELWTPAEITTALWLDAADSSTITLTSGKISQWNDKSGNARHVSQASDAARPVVTANGQNGFDVVTFDGSDSLATAANFPETGNAEFSVFWVHRKSVANSGSVMGWGNKNVAGAASGFWDDGGAVYTGWGFAGGTPFKILSPSTDWNLWSYMKTPGQIDITSAIFKNGSNAATSGHSTVTPNIQSAPFVVGSFAGAGSMAGSVAEVIICPSALSAPDRQVMDGYLAHKWGLSDNLPADHPYKSEAPTL